MTPVERPIVAYKHDGTPIREGDQPCSDCKSHGYVVCVGTPENKAKDPHHGFSMPWPPHTVFIKTFTTSGRNYFTMTKERCACPKGKDHRKTVRAK